MSTQIQDQWFSPGDKVMEVDVESSMNEAADGYREAEYSQTKLGIVYCVERFEACPNDWNAVWLVGIENGTEGLYAAEFRRVEEIRLCLSAVKKADELVKV